MEHNETLEKDVVLALALASGVSVTDASARAGVDRTTSTSTASGKGGLRGEATIVGDRSAIVSVRDFQKARFMRKRSQYDRGAIVHYAAHRQQIVDRMDPIRDYPAVSKADESK